jgi:chromate reductase, NAD(P)H dehydrogenase (quinone)
MTRILLLSGSTRHGSTNTAALRTLAAKAPDGVTADLYAGLAALPAFVPGDAPAPGPVTELRDQVTAADAVLICTPEYAGTLPGSLKNLLDWLVGSGELNDKPVAWLSVAASGRGDGALATLEMVLGYVDARLIRAACARVPVDRGSLTADGLIDDPRLGAVLTTFARELAGHRAA